MQATNIRIRPMEKRDAPILAHIQATVFPDLAPEERMQAEHFAFHVDLFPEGQWVAEVDGQVVGSSSAIRYDFDPEHPHLHRFADLFDEGYMRTHQPEGHWLYGMDMAVLPAFRGMGIARQLYRARQEVIQQTGLSGQVIVGLLNGYSAVASECTLETYFEEIKTGRRNDPTVSIQLRMGFHILALMPDYLNDPTCGNAGVLMVLPANIAV